MCSYRYQNSSPFAPSNAEVTNILSGNIYSYSPEKLWLAYGLAIGVTLIDVIIGLWMIFSARISFTADFSTVVRIAKNADLSEDVLESHPPGKDPLPKELAKATLRCRNVQRKHLMKQDYAEVSQTDEQNQGANEAMIRERSGSESRRV